MSFLINWLNQYFCRIVCVENYLCAPVLNRAAFYHIYYIMMNAARWLGMFRSGTDLMSLLILLMFLFLLGRPFLKQPEAPSFRIRSGWNLARLFIKLVHIDWWSRIYWCDVILSRLWPWRHFTQQSATTWWLKAKCLLCEYVATPVSSWSIVHDSCLFPNIG